MRGLILKIIFIAIFPLSIAIIPASYVTADDIPGVPMILYGLVNINGSVCGEGYWIEAKIDGNTIASCQTNSSGQYGYGSNSLAITASTGSTIYFYINGVQASTTTTFTSGAMNLNIQVSGTIPTSYTPPSNNITITTTNLSGGTVGTAYSTTLSATGGTSPYTWAISSGTLPAGLTLSSSGAISGTPTSAGTATFTVRATDSASKTGEMSYSISISAAGSTPAAVSILTGSLSGGTVGTAYSTTLSATGGSAPYSWSLTGGSLPGGLSLSQAGTITGTPTASGTYSFTVRVADSSSATAIRTFSVNIASPAPATDTPTNPTTPASTPSSSGTTSPSATGDSGSTPSSTPASSNVPAFAVSNMTATPVSARSGQYRISLEVANTGKATGMKVLQLKINDKIEAQQEVVLEPGESQVVTFTVNKTTPGSYRASIDPLSTDFTVGEGKFSGFNFNGDSSITLGILIGVVLVIILIILIIVYRKRQSDYY